MKGTTLALEECQHEAALTGRLFELGWLRPAPTRRAVLVTDDGWSGLATTFGVEPSDGDAG